VEGLATFHLTRPTASVQNETQPNGKVTMNQNTNNVDLEGQHDGFNVVREVGPAQWADYPIQSHGEYIHLVVDRDEWELRCYRKINNDHPSQQIKTTIEGVRFGFNYIGDSERQLQWFYLTAREAETFLSFVDFATVAREEGSTIGVSWWEESGKKANKDSKTGEETLTLTFVKPSGKERRVKIADTWVAESNQMAKYEEN